MKILVSKWYFKKGALIDEDGITDMFLGQQDVAVPDTTGYYTKFIDVVADIYEQQGFGSREAAYEIFYEDEADPSFERAVEIANDLYQQAELVPDYDGPKETRKVWIKKSEIAEA